MWLILSWARNYNDSFKVMEDLSSVLIFQHALLDAK